MKRYIKVLLTILLFAVMLVPSVKASAAVAPAAPADVKLACQAKSRFMFSFIYDSNIALSTDNNNFGYEMVVTTLKNKKIKTVDLNIAQNYSYNTAYDAKYLTPNILIATSDLSRMYMSLSSAKMQKQAFKIKVRAYTFDAAGAKVYGEYSSEKVIVPRATIKSLKATSKSTGKIKWQKVAGAKSYTVYVSSNGGTKFKKQGTTKATSYTVKNMKLGKEYPVYVVANGVKVKKKKYNSTKAEVKDSNGATIRIYLTY